MRVRRTSHFFLKNERGGGGTVDIIYQPETPLTQVIKDLIRVHLKPEAVSRIIIDLIDDNPLISQRQLKAIKTHVENKLAEHHAPIN